MSLIYSEFNFFLWDGDGAYKLTPEKGEKGARQEL